MARSSSTVTSIETKINDETERSDGNELSSDEYSSASEQDYVDPNKLQNKIKQNNQNEPFFEAEAEYMDLAPPQNTKDQYPTQEPIAEDHLDLPKSQSSVNPPSEDSDFSVSDNSEEENMPGTANDEDEYLYTSRQMGLPDQSDEENDSDGDEDMYAHMNNLQLKSQNEEFGEDVYEEIKQEKNIRLPQQDDDLYKSFSSTLTFMRCEKSNLVLLVSVCILYQFVQNIN